MYIVLSQQRFCFCGNTDRVKLIGDMLTLKELQAKSEMNSSKFRSGQKPAHKSFTVNISSGSRHTLSKEMYR
jgi:hypothetical protein